MAQPSVPMVEERLSKTFLQWRTKAKTVTGRGREPPVIARHEKMEDRSTCHVIHCDLVMPPWMRCICGFSLCWVWALDVPDSLGEAGKEPKWICI